MFFQNDHEKIFIIFTGTKLQKKIISLLYFEKKFLKTPLNFDVLE